MIIGRLVNTKLREGIESIKRVIAPKKNEGEQQAHRIAIPVFSQLANRLRNRGNWAFFARCKRVNLEDLVEPEPDYKDPSTKAALAQAIFSHAEFELISTHNLHRISLSSRLLSKMWFPDFQEIVFSADTLYANGLIGEVAKNAMIDLHNNYAKRRYRIDMLVTAYPSATYRDNLELKKEVDEFRELAKVWKRLAANIADQIRGG